MNYVKECRELLAQLWQYTLDDRMTATTEREARDRKGAARVTPMVPLPTPSSLVRNDFATLTSRPYLVAEKNDGVRAILLVGIENGTDEVILARVSRSGFVTDMRDVVHFKNGDTVEQGSVLDGEWMPRKSPDEPDTFVVFDCIAALGFSVKEANLTQRLVWAQSVVNHLDAEPKQLVITVKTFLDPRSPEGQTLLLDDSVQHSDGVIIAPDNEGLVGFGRQMTYFKYKPLEMITVDLYWEHDRNVLMCGNDGGDDMLIEAALPGVQWDEVDFKSFGESCLVECYVQLGGRNASMDRVVFVLKPKCRRHDKHRANSAFVVQQTCRNVEENITRTELAEVFCP